MTEVSLLGKTLLFLGLFFALFGLVILVLGNVGFVKLPGDILVTRPAVTIYIPVISSLVLSLFLTVIVNLFVRR